MATETYNRVNWQDAPSTETPINQANLNKMDKGIKDNNTGIKALEENLKANDGLVFNFAQDPNGTDHGYYDAQGNFIPFKTTHTQTKNITANGTTDMGVDHKYRYVNVNVPDVGFEIVTIIKPLLSDDTTCWLSYHPGARAGMITDYPSGAIPGTGGVIGYGRNVSGGTFPTTYGRYCIVSFAESSTVNITAKVNCYMNGVYYAAGQTRQFQQTWYGRIDGVCVISPA